MLAFDPWVVVRLTRGYAALAMLPQLLLPTLTQLVITWLAFRGARIGLAQPTLEDSALTQYGAEFDALTNPEREQLFRGRLRDLFWAECTRMSARRSCGCARRVQPIGCCGRGWCWWLRSTGRFAC